LTWDSPKTERISRILSIMADIAGSAMLNMLAKFCLNNKNFLKSVER